MANPFAPPVERTSYAPFHWGMAAFLVVNVLINYPKCSFSWHNGWRCDSSVNVWVAEGVVCIAYGLRVLAARSDAGRRFVWGFIVGLVALSVLSMGDLTYAWGEPVRALAATTRPIRERVAIWQRRDEAHDLWLAKMAGRQPLVPAATDLAAQVYQCATGRVEGQDSPAIPRDEAEISTQCPRLRPNSVSATDVRFPDRYRFPGYRGGPKDPRVSNPTTWDEGWRWKFSMTEPAVGGRPAQFDVTVAPDEELSFEWPRVSIEGRGLIRVSASATASPLTVSPVPDLLLLHECLQDAPAAHEQRTRGRRYASRTWSMYGMVHILCPELVPRVKWVRDDYNAMTLSVELPVGPRGSPATVAEYLVSIDVDETLPSFGFSLAAASINNTRHHLMTPDGSVHVTSEPRPATTDDPTALRCEVTLAASC